MHSLGQADAHPSGVPLFRRLANSLAGSKFAIGQINSVVARGGVLKPLAQGTDQQIILVSSQAVAVSAFFSAWSDADSSGVPVAGRLAVSVAGSMFAIFRVNPLAAAGRILTPLVKGTDRQSLSASSQAPAVSAFSSAGSDADSFGVPVAGRLAVSVAGSMFAIPRVNPLAATGRILSPLAKETGRHSPLVPGPPAGVSSSEALAKTFLAAEVVGWKKSSFAKWLVADCRWRSRCSRMWARGSSKPSAATVASFSCCFSKAPWASLPLFQRALRLVAIEFAKGNFRRDVIHYLLSDPVQDRDDALTPAKLCVHGLSLPSQ
jgi:hypothetical protein